MKVPVLLNAPSGRPARALGGGPRLKALVQSLVRASWPVVVHEPPESPLLQGLPGAQVVNYPPATAGLRQSSMVLLGESCPAPWREQALRDLEGTGVPLWDERDPRGSTLAFPLWIPGEGLSFAAWAAGGLKGWERELSEEFIRAQEAAWGRFLSLAGFLRREVLQDLDDEAFTRKVAAQLLCPEILILLHRGQEEEAKKVALKIVGSTTRTL